MAAYTSTGTGNWNNVATWGGGGYPDTAGDTATIAATHVVTLNVATTPALGTVTVNGTLKFSRTMSTILLMANTKFLTIGATGEVDMGNTGDIIPFPYVAQIHANAPAADNTTGIFFNTAGAKLYAYGDPVTYGSTDYAFLAADWVTATDANTFLVTGDFTDDGLPIAIAGLSVAAACVVTWTAHGLTSADVVKFAGITQADWSGLNGTRTITVIGADSFSVAVDTSGFGTPYNAGTDPGTYTRPKWKVGQELYVHKGTTYANYLTDINGDQGATDAVFTIASISYSSPNTTININESVATGQTFYQYGRVVNVTRNVVWKKSDAVTTIGNANTNRMHINGNNVASGTLDVKDIIITGSYGLSGFLFSHTTVNIVFRNGVTGLNSSQCGNHSNMTVASCTTVAGTNSSHNIINLGAAFCISGNAFNSSYANSISGNVYAATTLVPADSHNNAFTNLNFFSSSTGIEFGSFVNCKIGYNQDDRTMANTKDLALGKKLTLLFCKLPDIAGYTNVNRINTAAGSLLYSTYIYCEHFNQTLNDHRIIGAFGNSKKVTCGGSAPIPSQRSGGSTDSVQLSGMSNCGANSYMYFQYDMPPVLFTTGTAKTYRFYIQTDVAADALVTAKFKLYGTYIAQTTGLITEATASTQNITTRADASDWDQYVEITVPSTAQTGWVRMYFRLMSGTTTKFVWIDPKVVVS